MSPALQQVPPVPPVPIGMAAPCCEAVEVAPVTRPPPWALQGWARQRQRQRQKRPDLFVVPERQSQPKANQKSRAQVEAAPPLHPTAEQDLSVRPWGGPAEGWRRWVQQWTNSAGSQQVLLSGAVLVLTRVFQGSPDVVGLLTAPSPAAGIWLLKGNFPASRPHTRTAAWVILLQKYLH